MQKNHSNFDGQNSGFLLCEKLLTKSYCVYVFFDLHFFLIFTRNMFSIKLQCNTTSEK